MLDVGNQSTTCLHTVHHYCQHYFLVFVTFESLSDFKNKPILNFQLQDKALQTVCLTSLDLKMLMVIKKYMYASYRMGHPPALITDNFICLHLKHLER